MPRWTKYDQYAATVRADRCLNVTQMEPVTRFNITSGYQFNITACATASRVKLSALALFLTFFYDYNGTTLESRVVDVHGHIVQPPVLQSNSKWQSKQAAVMANKALQGNRYYNCIRMKQIPQKTQYFLEFKPAVIQYWLVC